MKKMKKATINKSTMSGLLLTSVLLTGCGGSGSTPVALSTYDKTTGFDIIKAQYSGLNGNPAIQNISVVQTSSDRGSSIEINATKDAISFTEVAGGQDVNISASDSVHNQYVAFEPQTIEGADVLTTAYQQTTTTNNGEFYVVSNVANYGDSANDYLSYGAWAYQPTTGTANQEVGVYVDGGDIFTTDISTLSGTATYNGVGGVAGLLRYSGGVETFAGDVTLTANFGSSAAISGEINNTVFATTTALNDTTIALNEATISNSGFWTGNTAEGKWGGQFYGNGATTTDNPEWAAGTFAFSEFGANSKDFIGTFIAKKE